MFQLLSQPALVRISVLPKHYQLNIWRQLWERKLLPRIVASIEPTKKLPLGVFDAIKTHFLSQDSRCRTRRSENVTPTNVVLTKAQRFFPETAFGGKSQGGAGWGENSSGLKTASLSCHGGEFAHFGPYWERICTLWRGFVHFGGARRGQWGKITNNSSLGFCPPQILPPRRATTDCWPKTTITTKQ